MQPKVIDPAEDMVGVGINMSDITFACVVFRNDSGRTEISRNNKCVECLYQNCKDFLISKILNPRKS